MSKSFYLLTADQDKIIWLNNFRNKLPTHATAMGVAALEIASVQNDDTAFSYWMQQVVTFVTDGGLFPHHLVLLFFGI